MLCTVATSDLLSSYFWEHVAYLVSCKVGVMSCGCHIRVGIAATAAIFLMLCYKMFDRVCMFNLSQTNKTEFTADTLISH